MSSARSKADHKKAAGAGEHGSCAVLRHRRTQIIGNIFIDNLIASRPDHPEHCQTGAEPDNKPAPLRFCNDGSSFFQTWRRGRSAAAERSFHITAEGGRRVVWGNSDRRFESVFGGLRRACQKSRGRTDNKFRKEISRSPRSVLTRNFLRCKIKRICGGSL